MCGSTDVYFDVMNEGRKIATVQIRPLPMVKSAYLYEITEHDSTPRRGDVEHEGVPDLRLITKVLVDYQKRQS